MAGPKPEADSVALGSGWGGANTHQPRTSASWSGSSGPWRRPRPAALAAVATRARSAAAPVGLFRHVPAKLGLLWRARRVSAAPSRLARARGPARPRLPLARPPAVTCWGQRPRSPARPPRRRPGSSRWPRPLRPGRPPASPADSASPSGATAESWPPGPQGPPGVASAVPSAPRLRRRARRRKRGGEEKLVRVSGRLRTPSKYLLNE